MKQLFITFSFIYLAIGLYEIKHTNNGKGFLNLTKRMGLMY